MPPTEESCPRHGGGESKSVSVGAYYPKPRAGGGNGGRMGGGGLVKTGTVGVQVGGLRASGAKAKKLEPVYGLDKVCPPCVKLTPNFPK